MSDQSRIDNVVTRLEGHRHSFTNRFEAKALNVRCQLAYCDDCDKLFSLVFHNGKIVSCRQVHDEEFSKIRWQHVRRR